MLASWQWVSDLWNIHFPTYQVWFSERSGGVLAWLSDRPSWLVNQNLPVQVLVLGVYIAMGVYLARSYWRDHPNSHPVWRTSGAAILTVGWGPIVSYIMLAFAVMMFYTVVIAYGTIVSMMVLVLGTMFEGGWKLITLPWS